MSPLSSEDAANDSTLENAIRLVKEKTAKLKKLAELRSVQEELAALAALSTNNNESDIELQQMVFGETGRLVDEIKQEIVGPDEQGSSSNKRAQSPEAESRDEPLTERLSPEPESRDEPPAKRMRRERDDPDYIPSGSIDSTSERPARGRRGPGLLPADIEWLHKNVEKYRGLGRRRNGISWIDLLADNESLAERMTVTQICTYWSQYNIRAKVSLAGPAARLQARDIQWLHANVERYRGVGTHPGQISWLQLLADNKDLGARMSPRAISIAWQNQLNKEKNRKVRKTAAGRKARKALAQARAGSSDEEIEIVQIVTH